MSGDKKNRESQAPTACGEIATVNVKPPFWPADPDVVHSRPHRLQTSTLCWYQPKYGDRAQKYRKPYARALIQPSQSLTISAAGLQPTSRLFYIRDCSTGLRFLVDIGAEVSIVPPSRTEQTHRPENFSLQAVNKTMIATYGTRSLTLDLGLRRTFRWAFIIDAHFRCRRPVQFRTTQCEMQQTF